MLHKWTLRDLWLWLIGGNAFTVAFIPTVPSTLSVLNNRKCKRLHLGEIARERRDMLFKGKERNGSNFINICRGINWKGELLNSDATFVGYIEFAEMTKLNIRG